MSVKRASRTQEEIKRWRQARNGDLLGGDVESISKTVTCTGELSALTCVIPRGGDFIPPLSRL